MRLHSGWCCNQGTSGPGPVLAVVLLFQLCLFAGSHWERWSKALVRLDSPRARSGEGLVIRCDGLGYYAWLRSMLIDGDLSFDNEFDQHNLLGDYVPAPGDRTVTGKRANPWSVGPACVWALTVIPGHLTLRVVEQIGLPWPTDGYSVPYQLLVGSTTVGVTGLGLVFLYRVCRRFAAPRAAALAAAGLTLGTTLVYYNALEVSMAHGLAATALAGFVDYWLTTYGSGNWQRWWVAGLLLGVAALLRWQLAGFAVLLLGEALATLERRALGQSIVRWTAAAVGAICAFSPQLVAWRLVYGHWLAEPIPAAPNWLRPAWQQILCATDRGFFYWTPLALLAFLAALALPWSKQRSTLAGDRLAIAGWQAPLLLWLGALLQIYVVAALWGPTVYLGAAYGLRHLTESLVAVAPGLAWLLDRKHIRAFRILALAVVVLVVWNLLLIRLYRYGWIPAAGGAELRDLAALSLKLAQRKRLLLVGQVLAAPAILGLWAVAVSIRPQRSRCPNFRTRPDDWAALASSAGSPKIAELLP